MSLIDRIEERFRRFRILGAQPTAIYLGPAELEELITTLRACQVVPNDWRVNPDAYRYRGVPVYEVVLPLHEDKHFAVC